MAYTTIPASSSGGTTTCAVTFVAQTTVSGAATSTIDVTGLNGDADILYKIVVYGKAAAGVAVGSGLFFEPNAVTTNQGYVGSLATSTVTGSLAWEGALSGIFAAGLPAAGDNFMADVEYYAKSGGVRLGFYRYWRWAQSGSPTNRTVEHSGLFWSDTSTVITSFRLFSGATNAFDIGTTMIVLKIQTS